MLRFRAWIPLLVVASCFGCALVYRMPSSPPDVDAANEWDTLAVTTPWAQPVTSLAVSSNGERVVAGRTSRLQGAFDDSRSSPMYIPPFAGYSLWRRDDHNTVFSDYYKQRGFRISQADLADVVMSRDGRQFAAIHRKGIDIRYTADGGLQYRLQPPPSARPGMAAISAEFSTAVWVSTDEDESTPDRLIVQDTSTRKTVSTIPLKGTSFGRISISPNGQLVAAPVCDRGWCDSIRIQLVNLKTGHIEREIGPIPLHVARSRIHFSPDNSMICAQTVKQVTPTKEGEYVEPIVVLSLWEVGTGRKVSSWELPDRQVWSLAFSPDGTMLAAGLEMRPDADGMTAGEIRVWDVPSNREIVRWSYYDHWLKAVWGVTALAFSPDGKMLAAGDNSGMMRFYAVPEDDSPHRISNLD